MRISVPRDRAYYLASKNEPHRLLCWIPPQELRRLAQRGRIRPDVVENYPDGLEVEVSPQGFAEFGIDLEIDPEAIRETYAHFRQENLLPSSGMVSGEVLENAAERSQEEESDESVPGVPMGGRDLRPALPEPDMTEGADPMTAMANLLSEKGE